MDNENNKKLIELVQQNPELPIIPATYYEVCAEDWGYWCGEISDVKVDYFYLDCDRWYAGESEIMDQLELEYDADESIPEMNREEWDKYLENKFKERVESGEIKKAIIMYIDN